MSDAPRDLSADPPAGLLIVDKDGAMTSHDVVARARRLCSTRKVGHAGTLDPMATGVLVLGVGRATRLLGHLTLSDKAYDATIRLGVATSTDDAEGEVVASTRADHLDPGAVRSALTGFVGPLDQVPSAVSAIKIDGKRAYARVRAGEEVVLEPRRVTVHALEVHDLRAGEEVLDVRVSLRCTSGTYVRAIARDLGRGLGVGGHLTRLRRTSVGPFTLDDAHTLAELGDDLALVGLDEAARAGFSAYELDEAQAGDVRFGRRLALDLGAAGTVAVFAPDGAFLALYEQRGELAHPIAVFTG